jgi:hypothetical protein
MSEFTPVAVGQIQKLVVTSFGGSRLGDNMGGNWLAFFEGG